MRICFLVFAIVGLAWLIYPGKPPRRFEHREKIVSNNTRVNNELCFYDVTYHAQSNRREGLTENSLEYIGRIVVDRRHGAGNGIGAIARRSYNGGIDDGRWFVSAFVVDGTERTSSESGTSTGGIGRMGVFVELYPIRFCDQWLKDFDSMGAY